MAGGSNPWIKFDPAILRWADMRENTTPYFRFTRHTIFWGVACLFVFPVSLQLLANWSNERWDWVGKRKGERLLSPQLLAEEAKDKAVASE